jgi:hypothetical protein
MLATLHADRWRTDSSGSATHIFFVDNTKEMTPKQWQTLATLQKLPWGRHMVFTGLDDTVTADHQSLMERFHTGKVFALNEEYMVMVSQELGQKAVPRTDTTLMGGLTRVLVLPLFAVPTSEFQMTLSDPVVASAQPAPVVIGSAEGVRGRMQIPWKTRAEVMLVHLLTTNVRLMATCCVPPSNAKPVALGTAAAAAPAAAFSLSSPQRMDEMERQAVLARATSTRWLQNPDYCTAWTTRHGIEIMDPAKLTMRNRTVLQDATKRVLTLFL